MDKMPTFHLLAAGLTALFGLTSLVGGMIGYFKANSTASLVAGGLSGVLLLLCAFGSVRLPVVSLAGALIIALALAGRFAPKALGYDEKAAGPVDYVMTIGGILVVIVCGLALLTGSKPPSSP